MLPTDDLVKLMRDENKLAQIETISETDHSFVGKQKELVDIVIEFLKNKIVK